MLESLSSSPWRLPIAFLLAPSVGALAFVGVPISADDIGRLIFILFFIYGLVFLIALPLLAVLSRFGLLGPLVCSISGFPIATIPFGLNLFSSPGGMVNAWNYKGQTILNGELTNHGIITAFVTFISFGVIGAFIGISFWFLGVWKNKSLTLRSTGRGEKRRAS